MVSPRDMPIWLRLIADGPPSGVGPHFVHPDPRQHIVALGDRHRGRTAVPALRKVRTVFRSAVVEMGNVLVRLRRYAGAENEQGNGQIRPSGQQATVMHYSSFLVAWVERRGGNGPSGAPAWLPAEPVPRRL